MDTLRSKTDLRTLSKIETIMVRDMLVLMYTCYQDYIIDSMIEKVKFHSDHEAIAHFVRKKIEHTNIEIKHLSFQLGELLPQYKANFKPDSLPAESTSAYTNIVLGRINVAHDQGNNLQIRSLIEVEEAHDNAKLVLESFRSCMWQADPRRTI